MATVMMPTASVIGRLVNRTQNSHILQLRSDVQEGLEAIMWLAIGMPSFSPYVPFYCNANDTDPSYSKTPKTFDIDADSAYWLHRLLDVLVEAHYTQFIQADRDYLTALNRDYREMIQGFDKGAKELGAKELTQYLTDANYKIVAHTKAATKALINEYVMESLKLSKLTFNMDKNL